MPPVIKGIPIPKVRSHRARGAIMRLSEKAKAYNPRFLPRFCSVLIRLISVSHDVVIAPNAKPIINRTAIQEKSEVKKERDTIRHPARNIPVKRVGLTPYSSSALPTRGALHAIPINMAVAQNPISGVGTSLPSRITDVTGIIIPQQKPTVKTALITVNSGEPRYFKQYPLN
jgi:hypothetical protein